MTSTLASTIALGLIRTALTSAFGGLVIDGFLTNDQLKTIVSAVITAGLAIWQAWSSWQKAHAVAIVNTVAAHPSISITTNAAGKPVVTAPAPGTAGSMTGLSVTGH